MNLAVENYYGRIMATCMCLQVAAYASSAPAQSPATPMHDCQWMAAVAELAAQQRDGGHGPDKAVDTVLREFGDIELSPERVQVFAKRVFDAPIPAGIAGAEAYSACLAFRDGIGGLALTRERVHSIVRCAETTAQGGAIACGYAETIAREKPDRNHFSIPTAHTLDAILHAIKGSIVLVESAGILSMGVVAPAGGYVIFDAPDLKVGDEVLVASAALPEQPPSIARVVGLSSKFDVAVVAPPPVNVRPVRIVDPAELIHGQPLVALDWDSEHLVARLVTVGNRATSKGGACFPTYVEVIEEGVDREIIGPVFDYEGRLAAFGAYYYFHSWPNLPLSLNLGTSALQFAQIAARVHRHGYWRFGRIGMTVQEMTQESANQFKMSAHEGVLVTSVEQRGPAAKAGLRRDDVVLALNGKPLAGSCDLIISVAVSEPGDVLELTVLRKASRLTIKVATVEGVDLPVK